MRLLPVLLLPIAGWAIVLQLHSGKVWTVAAVIAAVVAAALAWNFARRRCRRPRVPLAGVFLLLGSASIFGAAFPVVLPSPLNPDFSLTVANASSSDYTLA